MAPPKLVGTVGPGFTISLKQNGKAVQDAEGRQLHVRRSPTRRASTTSQIEGPGVDRAITTPSFAGTKTVTIRLRKGKYKFYCRPHESSMFGFFTVT